MEVTLGLAFAAGFISFISPCVLPLVPAYITYMGGRVTNTVAAQAGADGGQVNSPSPLARISTGLHSVFFVLGFSLVFVGFGIIGTAAMQQIGGANVSAIKTMISRAGGIIIIIFGLHFMDALTWLFSKVRKRESLINLTSSLAVLAIVAVIIFWAFDRPPSPFAPNTTIFYRTIVSLPVFTAFFMWLLLSGAFTDPHSFWLNTMDSIEYALYADTRQQMNANGYSGFGGSALMGIVFAAGWTPCIGPIYGAILTLAANGGSVSVAGEMLTAYSLGLGIPFILTALALDGAQGILRGLSKHMRAIKLASGIFLVVIGVMIATEKLQEISRVGANSEFSVNLEECFTGAVGGQVGWGQFRACMNGEIEVGEAAISGESANVSGVTVLDSGTVELNEDNSAVTVLDSGTIEVEQPENIDAPVDSVPAFQSLSIEDAAGSNASIDALSDVPTGTNIGDVAPNFSTFTADGEPVNLYDLRGNVVLLNFWFTRCGPCRIEMPEFQAAYETYSDDGFTILAVNNRENARDITDFSENLELTFPMVMDLQGTIQDQYGIFSYPSTYLIDANGVIIERHFGALTVEHIGEMITEAVES